MSVRVIDISGSYLPDVAIVANGLLEGDAITMRLLQDSRHTLVCDGALQSYCALTSSPPDLVIGDGDSVAPDLLADKGYDHLWVEEQETNDLAKAVRYALQQGWSSLCLLGATGKREDHSIGNIAHMVDYARLPEVTDIRIYSPYGWMIPFAGRCQVCLEKGRQLSLFSLSSSPISARGVRYPFEGSVFSSLWQATLNEALGGIVEVETEGSGLLYIAHEIK